jgi:NAD(P)-dependent dehydrogenase (short-subunit alcohol dehydrogenase family)
MKSGTLQVDTNLKSVFLACKHVLPTMLAQRRGSIVNVASTSGLRWTGSAQVAYAATKAGVIQLSRVVAVQHAPMGVRVNTVVPGQLHTPMVEARLAKQRSGGDVDGCSRSASSAFRWASWATAATRPPPSCTWPVTTRASSPAPRSSSTAA